ncbi:MAG: hypothetical protein PHU25_11190 [Deltaproteobacteria bacterium]|nr:hypothetical protein [Deltaproteobacteria bacterium]
MTSPLLTAAGSILLLAVFAARAALGDEGRSSENLSVTAARVTVDGDGRAISADSGVRLETSGLVIEADEVELDRPSSTVVAQGNLRVEDAALTIHGRRLVLLLAPPSLTIDEPRVSSFRNGQRLALEGSKVRCASGVCVLKNAAGTACPHDPPGYHVTARKMVLHESGDVDLDWPVLYVADTPVLALPWLRIRPPGSAGFLPPRLGFDKEGGFIVGPAGLIPLGSDAALLGHVAARTSQGMEMRTALESPQADLSVDYLLDAPASHGRLRGRLSPSLEQGHMAAELDLLDDRRMIDDLASDPLERARTHTSNRVLVADEGDLVLVETRAAALEAFDPDGRASMRLLEPVAAVGLTLPPVPATRFVWPGASVTVERFESGGLPLAPAANGWNAPSHTRVGISPSLAVPARLGPFALDSSVASLHRFWLPDGRDNPSSSSHVVAGAIDVSLPLLGHPLDLRHVIVPLVRYRVTPLVTGSEPAWAVDDLDRVRQGHGLEGGISTEIGRKGQPPLATLEAIERMDLSGWGEKTAPAYLASRLDAGPRWLSTSLGLAWDHERDRPSLAFASLASRTSRASGVEIGARWLGPGRGPQVDRPWELVGGPWLGGLATQQSVGTVEVYEQAQAAFTRSLFANVGVRVGAWPRTSLNVLSYGIAWRSACGCLAIGLTASHRLDTAVPDVMATFALADAVSR